MATAKFPLRPQKFTMDELRQAHADGLTLPEAAVRLNADATTVGKFARADGLKFKPVRRPEEGYKKYDRDMIRTYLEQGKDRAEIAELTGAARETIGRIKRDELKMPMKPQIRYSDEVRARAKAMLEDGASYLEVERTLGPKARTLSKWFPGMGWDPRDAVTYRHMMRVMDSIEGKSGSDLLTTSNQHSLDRLDAIE